MLKPWLENSSATRPAKGSTPYTLTKVCGVGGIPVLQVSRWRSGCILAQDSAHWQGWGTSPGPPGSKADTSRDTLSCTLWRGLGITSQLSCFIFSEMILWRLMLCQITLQIRPAFCCHCLGHPHSVILIKYCIKDSRFIDRNYETEKEEN